MTKENIYDLIIIGGGPAGITAGIYAARQKLKILLLAKGFGGQVARKAVAIENYPGFEEISGIDLIQRFKKHLKKFEVSPSKNLKKKIADLEIKEDEVSKIEKSGEIFFIFTKNKEEFRARAVLVASGADPRPLEVPGEKEFIGRGVSYCVTCDGPLFQGKTIAVIGGGNAGLEAALALANYASKIYILEYSPRVRADEVNQEKVRASKKIQVITSAILKKIQGKEFVNSIIYQDRQSKEMKTIWVKGVFIEIGSQPATSFVKDLVDFNERDEIKIDPSTCQTRTPGLFAAGDVTDIKYKQIVIAAGEGAKAGLSAIRYLQKQI